MTDAIAPILLGILLLFHPNGYGLSPDERVMQLDAIRDHWLILHVALLPLFALIGLIVTWMLPRNGVASRVSQIALAA